MDNAYITLRDRILERADGCSTSGMPDADDWIVDCVDQNRLSSAGARLLRAIDALR
jgi:hypothetical protein